MPIPSIGAEITVNRTTAGEQTFATVAAMVTGGFAIAWRHDATHYGVQLLNAEGFNLSTDNQIAVGGTATAFENRVEIVGLPNGDSGVAYVDTALNDGDVLFRFFNRGFSPGGTVNVSDLGTEAGLEECPFITVQNDGTFLVNMRNVGEAPQVSSGVFEPYSGPRFQTQTSSQPPSSVIREIDGTTNGTVEVVTYTYRNNDTGNVMLLSQVLGLGSHPHIEYLPDSDSYAVAYVHQGTVKLRIVTFGITTTMTPEVVISGNLFNFAGPPDLTALDDGRLMVVWSESFTIFRIGGGSSTTNSVFGRICNSDGTPDSDRFLINSLFSDTQNPVTGSPRVAELADGRVVVTYQDGFAGDADIKARILDPRTTGVTISGTALDDEHVGTPFDDTFFEGDGSDVVKAGGGNDRVFGGARVDFIEGEAGNDRLNGGFANDQMRGGPGDDQYFVDNKNDLLTENAGQGTDRVLTSVSFALRAGHELEFLATTNAAGTAPITLTGNGINNTLTGNAGANSLNGLGGIDTMSGLGGNDHYIVDSIADILIESAGGGNDRVFASVSYVLSAGQEIETLTTTNGAGTASINLTGNAINNTITGNAGINILQGGGGNDTMSGLAGNDTYIVDGVGDVVIEAAGGGADRVLTTATYILPAVQQIEVLASNVPGGTTTLTLIGNNFVNDIKGNAGVNAFNGAGGNDALTGLGGRDTFVFSTALNASTNLDRVTDFIAADDTFMLENAVFSGLPTGALAADAFHLGAAAADAEDRIIYNRSTGALFFDSNGVNAGGSIQFATLVNKPVISNLDFTVV